MSATTPHTILVVDDDVEVAQALARTVRSLGHDVRVAYDGETGLALLRETPVDVLLSDIDMPRLDGVGLVTAARRESLATVRILITANATVDTAMRAINDGEVHRYVAKPWKMADIVATLDDAFSRLADLAQRDAADHAVRRMQAVRDALENEYPGLTHVEREQGHYVLDEKRARRALEQARATVLYELLGSLD